MSNPSISADVAELRLALRRRLYAESLADYAAWAWPLVTHQPLRRNIAIDGVLTTLQAIADGHSKRTIIEIGPGLGKSTANTIEATWQLARDARRRTIRGSHAHDLAARDSRRARRLVESEQWKALFAARLRPDENTAARWTTVQDGAYLAIGTGSSLTGHRAHSATVDDALNAIDAHSKAKRDETYAWFCEGLMTRIDGEGPITVIGQRLGTDDLQGRLRETGHWTIVTIPAEYDPKRRCFLFARDGAELWSDTRTEEGELAAPEVLGREKLCDLKLTIGSLAYESQYNQAPASADTSICPARWWKWYRQPHAAVGQRRPVGCDDGLAVEMPAHFQRVTIAMDATFGATGKTADYAVVTAWGAHKGGRYCLDLWRRRAGFDEQVAALAAMVQKFPGAKVVIELAANGRAVLETIRKTVPGVVGIKAQGAKAARISAVCPQIQSGSCFLPEGAAWASDLVDEFQTFPGRHDDIPDAVAYCLSDLAASRVHAEIDGGEIGYANDVRPRSTTGINASSEIGYADGGDWW